MATLHPTVLGIKLSPKTVSSRRCSFEILGLIIFYATRGKDGPRLDTVPSRNQTWLWNTILKAEIIHTGAIFQLSMFDYHMIYFREMMNEWWNHFEPTELQVHILEQQRLDDIHNYLPGCVYIFGGWNNEQQFNDLFMLDIENKAGTFGLWILFVGSKSFGLRYSLLVYSHSSALDQACPLSWGLNPSGRRQSLPICSSWHMRNFHFGMLIVWTSFAVFWQGVDIGYGFCCC